MTDLSYHVYSKCDRCREGVMAQYDNLCYYHQKIEDGLIDEPEHEIPYAEVWVENEEMLNVFMDQCNYWANALVNDPQLRGDAKNYAGMGYRQTVYTWDQELVAWSTHCSMKIRARVIDFVRKEALYNERYELSADDFILEDSNDPEYLCILKADRDDLRDAISNAMLGMSDREHMVLWRRMIPADGKPVTLQELADRYGTTESSIRRDEQRIIKRLGEEMEYVTS